jgi:hypothetical protein
MFGFLEYDFEYSVEYDIDYYEPNKERASNEVI